MSNFFDEQSRTRVYVEAYSCTPQTKTCGEHRSSEKGPFLDGSYFVSLTIHSKKSGLPPSPGKVTMQGQS
jgi:hypothetical protein